jgi:hypothetical protein
MSEETKNENNNTTKLVFMFGRMNPPTPGHMLAIEKVLELANTQKGIPRIYISTTENKPQNKLDSGIFLNEDNVKDKDLQNPLTVKSKKDYIIKMIVKRKAYKNPLTNVDWTEEELKEVVVPIYEKGLYGAFKNANSIAKNENITYVLGEDTDEKEKRNRMRNCIDEKKNDKILYNCVTLKRTNNNNNSLEAISGSKIRLIAGGENSSLDEFKKYTKNISTPKMLKLYSNKYDKEYLSNIKQLRHLKHLKNPSIAPIQKEDV